MGCNFDVSASAWVEVLPSVVLVLLRRVGADKVGGTYVNRDQREHFHDLGFAEGIPPAKRKQNPQASNPSI